MTFTKKEKQLFWYGALLAVGGGILGNLFTSLWAHLIITEASKFKWGSNLLWIIFFIVFISLMYVIWFIYLKVKEANKIKKGRPKKWQK